MAVNRASRRVWVPVACLIGVVLTVLANSFAGALDSSATTLWIHGVDARGDKLVIDVVDARRTSPKNMAVTVDGASVKPTVKTLSAAGIETQVVVVFDNSSAVGNGAVESVKGVLESLVPTGEATSGISVVTAGGGARLAVPMTTSASVLGTGLSGVHPTGSASLWDAVLLGLDQFSDSDSVRRQLVILSGTADSGSTNRYTAVAKAMRTSDVTLHVFAFGGGTPDTSALTGLESITGGTYQVGNSTELETAFTTIARQIAGQFVITVNRPKSVKDGDLTDLSLTWAGQSADVSFTAGELVSGSEALTPVDESQSLLDRFMSSSLATALVVLLATGSAGVIVYTLAMLVTRDTGRLDRALRQYEGYVTQHTGDQDLLDESASAIRRNPFVRKAVKVTNDLAEQQGMLEKVEELLERANLPLRAAEAMVFYAAGVVVAGLAAALLSGDFLVLVAVVIGALLLPKWIVNFRAKRISKRFVAQLPDMLQLLSGTLRAGYSVSQGLEAVSNEIPDPMGLELRRVMAEARLGRPLEQALDAAAERTASADFAWAVMAIRIQREVGGNLAELLMTVSETMTQRERLRRDVAGLTAEGRMSAMVLGLLPPGVGLVMWVMNPEYIGQLTSSTFGLVLLMIAAVSMGIGGLWMKKIINIEI